MSGSACPPDLMRWFQGKVPRCAVTQLWGMTETTGALYTRPGDSIDIAANSAGQPSPGTEIRVVDGEGRVCEAEETGELQVCGCLLFPGFFDNDAANQTAFTADRWYRTGDLAKRNAGGNVAITLCEKDIINRGGVNSIRAICKTCSTRTRGSCNRQLCQCRTRYWGERACCFITLRPDAAPLTLEDIVAFLLEHDIAKNKLPERLVTVAEMPLTPARKIIKGRLTIPPVEAV